MNKSKDLKPIYTEPENCQDCYKCVRECPVKAIRIENNKAYIIEKRCIYCGHCTQVCPTGAKKIRDGVSRARLILQHHPQVILSLAPSWACEFENLQARQLVAAIRKLGFSAVSETAIGAELVSARVTDYLQQSPPGVYISSACPVVVEYIRKYSTEHISAITPLLSPMLSHAKILKQHYGEEVKIIFAGPCICKKLEADNFRELVEVAITFKDLKGWLEKEGIHPENLPETEEDHFVPWQAGIGSLYPIEGGMLPGVKSESKKIVKMAFSDLSNIKDVIKNIDCRRKGDSIFLELLACKGGCINGPAKLSQTSLAIKRYNIQKRVNTEPFGTPDDLSGIDLSVSYRMDDCSSGKHTEEEVKQALAAVGKTCPEDELNCSGCGYDSCRDFALAMLEGRAEENMCVSYMRKVAHDKATVLLQKIPAGILLVDNELKISDMNSCCAHLLGEEVITVYEASPGLQGVELSKICPFTDLFQTVLSSGKEMTERKIREQDKIWLLSIYNIQPHRLVFGILQDLREPYVRQEWMLEKTREVIQKHMATVQEVACLLGENAAFTDATLRTVMEATEAKLRNEE
ncbi:MAG: [Fe-Fe] hydrogenase large subunit C-terminal domain-containing protein [Odoribacter sp.]